MIAESGGTERTAAWAFGPSEWESFCARFRELSGLNLGAYKAHQIQRRVLGAAAAKRLSNLERLGIWLGESEENVEWFRDKLAINVTELFRDPVRWAALRDRVLPSLAEDRRPLQCWSAGCSYGAEAYSMAALLAGDGPPGSTVLGTDIDRAALRQARRGAFSNSDMKSAPPALRDAWFEPAGDGWLARPELRSRCSFRPEDLLSDSEPESFDLILCRNVVIYFNEAAKTHVFRRLLGALRPGGILFVGGTERIFRYRDLGFECTEPYFYRRPLPGMRLWRKAA